jgi:hypothetical protein
MCYDASSSIQSYGLVSTVALLTIYFGDKYDKHIALFILAVIQMQLAEYWMWIDQSCTSNYNKLGTYYGLFILLFQPLVVLFGGYYWKTLNFSLKTYFILFLLMVIPGTIRALQYIVKENKTACSRPGKSKHLKWDFFQKPTIELYKNMSLKYVPYIFQVIMYFLLLIVPWFFMKNRVKGPLIGMMVISSFLYHFIQYKDDWASMWCYSTKMVFFLYLVVSFLVR